MSREFSPQVDFDLDLQRPLIVGADEVGRGCLAGPIVAAAVRFDYSRMDSQSLGRLSCLNDSKQVTKKRRGELFEEVLELADGIAIVSRTADWIDRIGLHKTNIAILQNAISKLGTPAALCLSDGYAANVNELECRSVTKGDATSATIAAASIVAKVTRDRFMQNAAVQLPHWGFESHVGYSSQAHRDAIVEHGLTALHRRSFASAAYAQMKLVA